MQDRRTDQMGRIAARLAWSLLAVCVVLIALSLALDYMTGSSYIFEPGERDAFIVTVLIGVLSLAYPAVGALIASRLPTNPIGWIFCSIGLVFSAQRFAAAYAD